MSNDLAPHVAPSLEVAAPSAAASHVARPSASGEASGATAARLASDNDERGATHGFEFILYLLQQRGLTLLAIPTVVAGLVTWVAQGSYLVFAITWLAVALGPLTIFVIGLIVGSYADEGGEAIDWEPFVSFRDPADAARYRGKKIPMETVYEAYMAEKLDFKQDVREVLLRRNRLFRFCFTIKDITFYLRDFLKQNVDHSVDSDHGEIAHVYDRGNDFYQWFLGPSMIYTCGIFQDPNDSLEDAQRRKLDMICKTLQMKPGDRHFDFGCGWGPLLVHAAKNYGTVGTGITLAKEQAAWARDLAEKEGVSDRVNVIVNDYRKIPAAKYDKITCVEMAEHVGIKNFQKFLLQVRGMLEDDGAFYLQIAGLRRPWHYEDLVWGLFMGKYIFPAADASCPLAFVVSQAERAGFEVHRVENTGVHYGLTIHKWYENWKANEAAVVAKYGQRWYRLWMMFLGWSTLIAAQGSSTVFMITLTKNTKNDKYSVAADEAEGLRLNRTARSVGPDPVATQQ
jgi:cyclopropane fatty-acyl-phospholipid synthase-like methyltransferase